MRVVIVSKAFVVGTYQRKLELMAAQPNIELTAIVPPGWREPSGALTLERSHTVGYRLLVEPIRWDGRFHWYYFPTLSRRLREIQPDLVHVDEEPYNLATWLGVRAARRIGAKTVIFSWQNIQRAYPPPFSIGERWTLGAIDGLIAGTQGAADVWTGKGYRGKLAVIPQFGVDPAIFAPASDAGDHTLKPFTIGFVGRLVPEKGADVLIRSAAALSGEWQLVIAGQGPERDSLHALASSLGIGDRVTFTGQMPSAQLPEFYRSLDVLVAPSISRPNWKEQFGRAVVEAMACGVPVIGSNCGTLPAVIGAGGLITPESDVPALTVALADLVSNPNRRRELGIAGRARVIEQFTQGQVAANTVAFYRRVLDSRQASG